jgi:hypothetical protein
VPYYPLMKPVLKIPSVPSHAGLFLLVFISLSSITLAQNALKTESAVSTYLYIKGELTKSEKEEDSLVCFILSNIDTLGKPNWKSKEIKEFEKDRGGYFLKANIPAYVSNNSRQIWCTSVFLRPVNSKFDTIRTRYGGVKLSKIKLILNSTPEGAESYLVPNRIWIQKFANTSWDKNDSELEKFRVNTSSTNTYAYVDQTVYVVIFKLNDKYKKVIHFTKPASVQEEQPVWIKF